MEISEEAREKREAYAPDGRTAWPTGIVRDAALVLWETSRRDEGTISAAGANIAAQALADAGLLVPADYPTNPEGSWRPRAERAEDKVERLTRERDRWREKAQESGKAYADANTKHHQEWDRADRLERLADTLAEKAVDLEDRARAAEAGRDDLLAMKARVEARVEHALDRWRATTSHGLMDEIRAAIRGES